jgi:hypothetical protein
VNINPETELRIRFWLYTSVTMIVILPVMLLVVINPFWFRERLVLWFDRWMNRLFDRRTAYLRPYADKVNLFDYVAGVKNPQSSNSNRPRLL